jgi:hypothetical protein
VIIGTDDRPGVFNFSQEEYAIKNLGTETVPVSVYRNDGSKGEGTVLLAFSLGQGPVVFTIPVSFANREIRQTVDVLGQINGSAALAGSDEVMMKLELPVVSVPGEPQIGLTNQAKVLLYRGPQWTLQPSSTTTLPGNNVVLQAAASGSPKPVYQWFKDGVALAGKTDAQLTLEAVNLTDSGSYTVVASNRVGTVTSQTARLAVVAPPVPTLPVNYALRQVGESVTFNVESAGAAPFTYQWRKNGQPIDGATGPALTLVGVQETDAADYTVVVSNQFGEVTSAPARLEVQRPDLSILSYPNLQRGNYTLWLQGPVGAHVRVLTSSDLKTWTPLTDMVFIGNWLEYHDEQAATTPIRFYRVVPSPN